MITELNTKIFDNEIKSGVKLVEFYTDWCGYCKKQRPELEQMEKVWIGTLNADKSPEIASKYEVSGFPTFIIFKNGIEAERFSGLRNKESIMSKVLEHIK